MIKSLRAKIGDFVIRSFLVFITAITFLFFYIELSEHRIPKEGSEQLKFKESYEIANKKAKEWQPDAYLEGVHIHIKNGEYLERTFFFQSKNIGFYSKFMGNSYSSYVVRIGGRKFEVASYKTGAGGEDNEVEPISISINKLFDSLEKVRDSEDIAKGSFVLSWHSNSFKNGVYYWYISRLED